jgi:hypothetical protein
MHMILDAADPLRLPAQPPNGSAKIFVKAVLPVVPDPALPVLGAENQVVMGATGLPP